jgi:hypothetical protein
VYKCYFKDFMKHEEIETQRENEPTGVKIAHLCAALQLTKEDQSRFRKYPYQPEPDMVFIGWDEDGRPLALRETFVLGRKLSCLDENSMENFRRSKAINIGEQDEYEAINRLFESDLPIVAVNFKSVGKPFDRPDKGNQKTQDQMIINVAGFEGNMFPIQMDEIDFLDSVINGQISWDNLNPDTRINSDRDVIRSSTMYSLTFSGESPDGKQVQYVVLCPNPMPFGDETNDDAFKLFLFRSFLKLVKIDQNQPEEGKKGYEQIWERIMATGETASLKDLGNHVSGKDAYMVMNILKNIGLYNMSNEELENFRIKSSQVGFKGQILLLAEKIGLYHFNEDDPEDMDKLFSSFTVGDLRTIYQSTKSLVENAFHSRRW